MAQNLDLLTRLAYLQAGGRDPGQRDIDKINAIGSGVSGLGKSLLDVVASREALKKSALERKRLEQESMPLYEVMGRQTPAQTKAKVDSVMKQPIPAQDLISGKLDTVQAGLDTVNKGVKKDQDIYSKYGDATVDQAGRIAGINAQEALTQGREFVWVDANGAEVPEGTPGAKRVLLSSQRVAPPKKEKEYQSQQPAIQTYSIGYIQKVKPDITNEELKTITKAEIDQLSNNYRTESAEERKAARENANPNLQNSASSMYANRMLQAEQDLKKNESYAAKSNPIIFALQELSPDYLNSLRDPEFKQYAQAVYNFSTAVLRKESGATILQSELDNVKRQYFALPGDDPGTLEQKRINRAIVLEEMQKSAGPGYKPTTLVNPAKKVNTANMNFPSLGTLQIAVKAGKVTPELAAQYAREKGWAR